MKELVWTYKSFDELHAVELYAVLKLRSEVFVVEQNCVYLDTDNKDQASFHLCGWLHGELVAYVRILPPGTSYKEASIGRVCTALSHRKNGAGRTLMIKAIDITQKQFEGGGIKIGAQSYLNKFYSSLGFQQSGNEYIEDGITHIEMLLTK
ncbi:MAG: GNAT family N-acetyltransferase [Ferruginibacter sp.]|nr:GNAT family N-acetyltransferase [Ferruginibacter sp.]